MRFAGFQYSRGRGELRRDGERVAQQEQPMRLVGLLLERPGEIVSRERIREVLWKHNHGDHKHGINTAVRKLRSALEPASASGLRIATSAGAGYRLLLPPVPEQVPSVPVAGAALKVPQRLSCADKNATPTALF